MALPGSAAGPIRSIAADQEAVALSFAYKAAILAAIVVVLAALWAATSQPVSPDATLGTPLVGAQDQPVTQAAVVGPGD